MHSTTDSSNVHACVSLQNCLLCACDKARGPSDPQFGHICKVHAIWLAVEARSHPLSGRTGEPQHAEAGADRTETRGNWQDCRYQGDCVAECEIFLPRYSHHGVRNPSARLREQSTHQRRSSHGVIATAHQAMKNSCCQTADNFWKRKSIVGNHHHSCEDV